MFRGVGGTDIFVDDADRESLVCRLERVFADSGTACLSWALMTTHGHLATVTGRTPLCNVMQRVLTGYAMDFNRRHGRSGHLFQDRYRAILVEESAYADELLRYVILNPLREGIVATLDELERYKWTSLAALMGREPPRFVLVDTVLARFGPRLDSARHELRRWLRARLEVDADRTAGLHRVNGFVSHRESCNEPEEPFDRRLHTEVLGSAAFYKDLLTEVTSQAQARERFRRSSWTPADVLLWVCWWMKISVEEVVGGRRHRATARARAVSAYIMVELFGESMYAVGRMLGVSASAISRCVRRGRSLYLELGCVLPDSPPPELD